MNSRNKILIISLAGLLVMSLLLAWFGREGGKSEVDKQMFRVVDSEKIDQVILKSPSSQVDLKFENSRWRVNGQWDADPQMIKVLFAMLRQVEPRRPVAAQLRDSVRGAMSQSGVRVTLFAEGINRMTFYEAGNDQKTETYFIKDGDEQPWLVAIPGYRVYVGGVLELDDYGWRNKRIFDFRWNTFKSLTASYPGEPAQGFEVEMKDHFFGIKGIDADTTKLNNYLDAVSLLFASRYLRDAGADSVSGRKIGAHIEVKDIGNRIYTLDIFAPAAGDKEIFGKTGAGDVVAFERRSLSDILRRKTWFLPR